MLPRDSLRSRPATRAKTGGKGIRTPGLLIANETLYQLSYTPFSELRLARLTDFFTKSIGLHIQAAYALRFQTCGASLHPRVLCAAVPSPTQPSNRCLRGAKITGNKTWRAGRAFRHCAKPLTRPNLN